MVIVKLDTGEGGDGGEGGGDDVLVALKERSAEVLERAFAFLEREAGRRELDRARVLMGVDPADAWVEGIAAGQTEAGALPEQGVFAGGGTGPDDLAGQAPPPSLAGTFESLLVLSDAGALGRPCVERAGLYLMGQQNDDGSFGEADTPAPMRLFLTGMIAGLLGQTTHVRPDLLHDAGDWLAPRFSPEAVEGGNWPAITAYGTFFSNVGHERSDEALQWCGRELERGYRTGRFDACATVRALLYCDALAMPGAQLDPLELLERALGEQAGDGGFAELSPGGKSARITPTVEAIHAIVSLCQRF